MDSFAHADRGNKFYTSASSRIQQIQGYKDGSIINNENDDTDETEEDISNIEITGVDYSPTENHEEEQNNVDITGVAEDMENKEQNNINKMANKAQSRTPHMYMMKMRMTLLTRTFPLRRNRWMTHT